MFPYRRLFLAVTISLTSVVLGDVIVQPGYDHFSKNPYYLQPASHRINSQTEQYHTKQLPNQELQYLQAARTVYPYHESKDYSSNQVAYPYRHGMYSLRHHPHYARIGSHGYSRPSVFVGYRQPSIGHYHWGSPYHHHHRYRRSLDSDSTNTESSESANVAHDNDVASKSPLTDDKHPKATDSLLPEQEPTDTNDKHVENRQITFDPITGPRLFGIYPQNIIRFPEEPIRENTMQGIMQDPSMLNPSILNFDQNSQKNEQDCTCGNSHLVSNKPFSHVRFPKESSNYDYNSEAASPRWSGNYFGKLLLDNMRHQWAGYYHTYTPSYTSPAPKPLTLESLYMKLLRKYELLLQIAKQHSIPIQFLIQARQNDMPFSQKFSSTTDTPITKNEEDASWTPDTIEITRYLEQDLPEYMPLVSDSDQDNYPHHCLNCHENAPNYSSDDSKDNSDFQRNSNSAYRIEPSISIPNYDLNYAPDIDISVVPDNEIHKD